MTFPRIDAPDLDWQLRLSAIAAIAQIAERSGGVVTREELQRGFEFPGISDRIPFASRGAGIWRPGAMPIQPGAALSALTSLADPYADRVSDEGWIEYGYQAGPIDNSFNTALRNAFVAGRPLIYLRALDRGLFAAVQPVFIKADYPERRVVHLAVDTAGVGDRSMLSGGSPELLKRYATTTAIARLHQEKFRFEVLTAYARACAICKLGNLDRLVRLLDAAHILPDGDPRSLPVVSNGLSLCKIHHSAYDLNIVGIDPDRRVHVREDILAQVDGPMLQHGIKEMAGRLIRVPRTLPHRPNPDFLAERFEAFRAA